MSRYPAACRRGVSLFRKFVGLGPACRPAYCLSSMMSVPRELASSPPRPARRPPPRVRVNVHSSARRQSAERLGQLGSLSLRPSACHRAPCTQAHRAAVAITMHTRTGRWRRICLGAPSFYVTEHFYPVGEQRAGDDWIKRLQRAPFKVNFIFFFLYRQDDMLRYSFHRSSCERTTMRS